MSKLTKEQQEVIEGIDTSKDYDIMDSVIKSKLTRYERVPNDQQLKTKKISPYNDFRVEKLHKDKFKEILDKNNN